MFAIAKLLSFLAVIGVCYLSGPFHVVYVYLFTLVHYFVALVYGFRLLNPKQKSTPANCVLFFALAISAIVGLNSPYKVGLVYFGIHHALTEAYFTPKDYANYSGLKGPFFLARFLFHLTAYATITQYTLFQFADSRWWFFIATVACFLVLSQLGRKFPSADRQNWLFSELMTVGLTLAVVILNPDPMYRIGLLYVLFHVFLWLFIPFLKGTVKKNWRQVSRFAAINLIPPIVFVWAYYLFYRSVPGLFVTIENIYYTIGLMHITATFASSKLNPMFVRKFFALGPRTA